MTHSPCEAFGPSQVAALETWRVALGKLLQSSVPPETRVEWLTYRDAKKMEISRSVVIYRKSSRWQVEIDYPEPIEGIVERVLTKIKNGDKQ
jgi:hypothetical protein